MSKSLPQKPNLEHLRNEARDILKAHTSGDASCCPVLRNLRRFKDAPDHAILKESASLQEIQLALAIEYGYADWRTLHDAVEKAAGVKGQSDKRPGGYLPPDDGERMARLEHLLAEAPTSKWKAVQAIEFFKKATEVALAGGLVALDGIPAKLDDPFLRTGMQLAVDGADADIVRDVMIQRKKMLLVDYERRLDLEIAAVNGLVWGESPMVIEARCRAFLPSEEASRPA